MTAAASESTRAPGPSGHTVHERHPPTTGPALPLPRPAARAPSPRRPTSPPLVRDCRHRLDASRNGWALSLVSGKKKEPVANGTSVPPMRSPDAALQQRLERLEARVEHLDAALELLQDAVYRQAVREDKNIGELRRRTEPAQLARDLSQDARRRGLT